MPQPLTICLVSHLYPVSPDDYKAVFVHRIAAHLARRGHVVHVVTPLRPGGARIEQRDGVTIHRYWWWGWRRGRQLSQLRGTPPLVLATLLGVGMLAVIRVVLRFQLRLISAYWVVPGGFIAWVCGRLTGRRVVMTAAGSDLNVAVRRPLVHPFALWPLHGTDRLIACSGDLKRVALELGAAADRCEVVPWLVATTEPGSAPATPLPGDPGGRLLYVGNLTPPKRVDTLLRAMARVAREREGARLTLIGDGDLRSQLEALAESLGIAERVDFRGRLPNDRIQAVMRGADLLLHCSDNEGSPVVIQEALAVGLPVVAAGVGGIPDLVRDGESGRLLTPDDDAGFARAILELAGDAARRHAMGDAARCYFREHFDSERVIDRIESVYRAALGEGSDGPAGA